MCNRFSRDPVCCGLGLLYVRLVVGCCGLGGLWCGLGLLWEGSYGLVWLRVVGVRFVVGYDVVGCCG